MPINDEGRYQAPGTAMVSNCTCGMTRHRRGLRSHAVECQGGRELEREIRASMDFGTTFSSFVYELEAGTVDGGVSLGSLLCAVLEEQRTANLVAIAAGPQFSVTWRTRARHAVLERLGLDELDRGGS